MYELEGKSHISDYIYSYSPYIKNLNHNDLKGEYKVIKTLTESILNNYTICKDNILYFECNGIDYINIINKENDIALDNIFPYIEVLYTNTLVELIEDLGILKKYIQDNLIINDFRNLAKLIKSPNNSKKDNITIVINKILKYNSSNKNKKNMYNNTIYTLHEDIKNLFQIVTTQTNIKDIYEYINVVINEVGNILDTYGTPDNIKNLKLDDVSKLNDVNNMCYNKNKHTFTDKYIEYIDNKSKKLGRINAMMTVSRMPGKKNVIPEMLKTHKNNIQSLQKDISRLSNIISKRCVIINKHNILDIYKDTNIYIISFCFYFLNEILNNIKDIFKIDDKININNFKYEIRRMLYRISYLYNNINDDTKTQFIALMGVSKEDAISYILGITYNTLPKDIEHVLTNHLLNTSKNNKYTINLDESYNTNTEPISINKNHKLLEKNKNLSNHLSNK